MAVVAGAAFCGGLVVAAGGFEEAVCAAGSSADFVQPADMKAEAANAAVSVKIRSPLRSCLPPLNVEPEINYIAVDDDVIFSFQPEKPFFLYLRH